MPVSADPPGSPRTPTTAIINIIFAVTGIICLTIIVGTGLHVMIIYIQFGHVFTYSYPKHAAENFVEMRFVDCRPNSATSSDEQVSLVDWHVIFPSAG